MEDILKITPMEAWVNRKIGATGGQPLTLDGLRQYQAEKFWQSFNRAGTLAPFYRDLYREIDPAICHDLANISQLPLISEADLRRSGQRMLCVGQDEIHRIVTLDSSGTTGQPKRIYFSQADQELTVDFFANGMTTFTNGGDKVIIFLPCATPGCVGDLLSLGLKRFGAVPIPYGILDDCDRALALMEAENPQVAVANPVQMLLLANFYQRRLKAGGRKLHLQAILLSTDYLPDSLMAQLDAIFECPVYQHYGMTETGLGGGVACAAREGYHLREADLYFEVVDPLTRISLPAGETGEIVFSTLTRQAMPLLRYATGDRGRLIAGTCPCGSILPRLAKVMGRLNSPVDMAALDEIIFAFPGVLDYQGSFDGEILRLTIYLLDETVAMDLPQMAGALPYDCRLQLDYGLKPFMYQLRKRRIDKPAAAAR